MTPEQEKQFIEQFYPDGQSDFQGRQLELSAFISSLLADQRKELAGKISELKFKELNWLEWKATHNKAIDQVLNLINKE